MKNPALGDIWDYFLAAFCFVFFCETMSIDNQAAFYYDTWPYLIDGSFLESHKGWNSSC